MNFEAQKEPSKNEFLKRFQVEVYNPKTSAWKNIKEDIMNIELEAFGEEKAFDEETLERDFTKALNTIVFVKDVTTGKIIGFTYAKPTTLAYPEDFPDRPASEDTAYIYDTAFNPEYQGKGLLPGLMEKLEEELVKKGYAFIERDSADYVEGERSGEKKKTYADNVRKAYGERIIKEEGHPSEYGPQVFFRIRLKNTLE